MIKSIKAITASAYLSMFFLGVSASLIGAAARNIGLSPYQIGLMIAAQNVGFTVSVLLSGALADQVDKTKILFGGSLVLALAFFTFYLTGLFWLNLLIMFFIGAGIGTFEGVTDALLLEIHTRRQNLHINVNHFFVTFGGITIALYLTFLQVNWRNAVIQSGVVVLLLAAIFGLTRLPSPPGKTGEPYLSRLKILTRERTVILLFVIIILAVGIESGSIGILTTYLTDLRGFSEFAAKLGLIVFLVGMAAGRLLVGFFSKDDQVAHFTLALFGLAFVVFAAIFWFDFGALTYGGVFLTGLALSAILPLIISWAGLLYPDIAGTVLGVIKVAIPVGGIILPFFMSIIAKQVSLSASLLLFPLAALLGLGLVYVTIRQLKSTAAILPAVEAEP
jgi:predicted MFS family arabinose efflux permease